MVLDAIENIYPYTSILSAKKVLQCTFLSSPFCLVCRVKLTTDLDQLIKQNLQQLDRGQT